MTATKKPHKHAAIIKAWADGESIQTRGVMTDNKWMDVHNPTWREDYAYRIKHRWNDVEDAANAGKTIQFRRAPGCREFVVPAEWTDYTGPVGDAAYTYDWYEWRVKPETLRYRVALFRGASPDGGQHSLLLCTGKELAERYEAHKQFSLWLTEWVEVYL